MFLFGWYCCLFKFENCIDYVKWVLKVWGDKWKVILNMLSVVELCELVFIKMVLI